MFVSLCVLIGLVVDLHPLLRAERTVPTVTSNCLIATYLPINALQELLIRHPPQLGDLLGRDGFFERQKPLARRRLLGLIRVLGRTGVLSRSLARQRHAGHPMGWRPEASPWRSR